MRKIIKVERIVDETEEVKLPWRFQAQDRSGSIKRELTGPEVEEKMRGKRTKYFFMRYRVTGGIELLTEANEQDW